MDKANNLYWYMFYDCEKVNKRSARVVDCISVEGKTLVNVSRTIMYAVKWLWLDTWFIQRSVRPLVKHSKFRHPAASDQAAFKRCDSRHLSGYPQYLFYTIEPSMANSGLFRSRARKLYLRVEEISRQPKTRRNLRLACPKETSARLQRRGLCSAFSPSGPTRGRGCILTWPTQSSPRFTRGASFIGDAETRF